MGKSAGDERRLAFQTACSLDDRIMDYVHKPPSGRVIVVEGEVDVFDEIEVYCTALVADELKPVLAGGGC